MPKYKIHPRYASKKQLITLNADSKAVNLCGTPVLKKYPATLTTDEWSETIPAATQKDLEFVYKSNVKDSKGFQIVIVDESEPPAKADSKK